MGRGLDFLFVAEYSDGSVYYQTPQDISRQNPLKSAFYDIRQSPLIPEEKLVKFGLIRLRAHPILVVVVDLRTGAFTLNGQPIPIPPNAPRKRDATPIYLIYERRNELEINGGGHKVIYRLGWKHGDDWLALDLHPYPEKIELNGSHNARIETRPVLIG